MVARHDPKKSEPGKRRSWPRPCRPDLPATHQGEPPVLITAAAVLLLAANTALLYLFAFRR